MTSLDAIADAIADVVAAATADGIAGGVTRLVAEGSLAAGARLPTVRSLARRLEVSPTTVAGAWRHLVDDGVIETRKRAGSFVAASPAPRRRSWLSGQPGRWRLDLSAGTPDAALLPEIPRAVREGGAGATRSYRGPVVLPELEEIIRDRAPFTPEKVTVVDGALDALDRVCAQVIRRGAAVIVEDPCFPPIAELVELHGGRRVPVPIDDEGLQMALTESASVIIYQPRAANPTGVTTSRRRMASLGRFVERHPDVIVIEDDSAGDIAFTPPQTLAATHAESVVHIVGFSKSHGPDLRLAAVAGPGRVIDAVVERRRLGPVWTSWTLQGALLAMLTDPAVIEQIARARSEYGRRRQGVVAALGARGLEVGGTDGINLWVPVADERDAMVALASSGIGVAPGSPFQLRPGTRPHIRVTIATVDSGWDELATLIVEAASGAPPALRSHV
jgi:DNA-binding transcriptional MocR family regulator